MKKQLELAVVVEALIWAAVIAAFTMLSYGSPQFSILLTILGGGAAATIILLGGIIARN